MQPDGAAFSIGTPLYEVPASGILVYLYKRQLLQQPFRLVINEDAYDIDASEVVPFLDGQKKVSDTELLSQRLAHSVQVISVPFSPYNAFPQDS